MLLYQNLAIWKKGNIGVPLSTNLSYQKYVCFPAKKCKETEDAVSATEVKMYLLDFLLFEAVQWVVFKNAWTCLQYHVHNKMHCKGTHRYHTSIVMRSKTSTRLG